MASDIESDTTTYGEEDDYMLTTVDNPFSPFTQFKEWHSFDTAHGYHTAAFLARIVQTSDDLSEADQHAAIQAGIEEIVSQNVSGMHRKVLRSFYKTDEEEEESSVSS